MCEYPKRHDVSKALPLQADEIVKLIEQAEHGLFSFSAEIMVRVLASLRQERSNALYEASQIARHYADGIPDADADVFGDLAGEIMAAGFRGGIY
jgi:hypothetical protein